MKNARIIRLFFEWRTQELSVNIRNPEYSHLFDDDEFCFFFLISLHLFSWSRFCGPSLVYGLYEKHGSSESEYGLLCVFFLLYNLFGIDHRTYGVNYDLFICSGVWNRFVTSWIKSHNRFLEFLGCTGRHAMNLWGRRSSKVLDFVTLMFSYAWLMIWPRSLSNLVFVFIPLQHVIESLIFLYAVEVWYFLVGGWGLIFL